MKKFCTKCGHEFEAVGREVICPSCKAAAAQAAKRAAVERAKMLSYTGAACPVRISAKARGFIEAVAERKGMKFIPTLDAILRPACKMYGFENWDAVPEHKTARRGERAQDAQDTPQAGKQATDKPQEVKTVQAAKQASKASASKAAGKAVKAAGKKVKA